MRVGHGLPCWVLREESFHFAVFAQRNEAQLGCPFLSGHRSSSLTLELKVQPLGSRMLFLGMNVIPKSLIPDCALEIARRHQDLEQIFEHA